jgi:superfamily II DNA or RNA helicase
MVQISQTGCSTDPQDPTDKGPSKDAVFGGVRVGDRVRVRCQRWLITEVRPHDACALLTLSGLGAANLGVEQSVLAPFERIEPLAARRTLRSVRATRWRRACRELIADDGHAGILRTARSARMDLLPHQLEPALAIVRGLGSRVLIADEVGLGKTVQAALVVAELRARGAATRVLVLAPAGLREQWSDEFATRFNLRLVLFDMVGVARHRASLPVSVNPWSIEPLIVTSIDYVKRPEVLPAVRSCRWDVVIVDEAHHVASGTDRHDAVAALCRRAPCALLLTATPHNGDPRAFASLCAIGRHDDSLIVFRRTRNQIGDQRERSVHQLRVQPSPAERHMHACLAAFARAVQREHGPRDSTTSLALSTLRKRAISSAFALQRSVERRLETLASGGDTALQQLSLPLGDMAGEFDLSDEAPPWAIPALRNSRQERTLLKRVAMAAEMASRRETKLDALDRLLRRIGEPAIVFTEYRDTLLHVRDVVAPNAAVIHGGLSRDERRASLARFARGGILLSTDAASEGLNLHQQCRVVINLELPWNPMRLEQRIGRVDRIGQRRRVHAFHLIAAATSEVRILERLAVRIARAQADVGAADPLSSATSESGDAVPGLAFHRLGIEAKAEHERLTFARKLGVDAPTRVDRSGFHAFQPLVTFSKRRGIRQQLGSRTLVVFRACLSDDIGRIAASHLTPVLVRGSNGFGKSLGQLDACGLALTDGASFIEWCRSSRAVHERFWKTRLDREIAIGHVFDETEHKELQPGLFDLRAEHDRRLVVEHQRDVHSEGARQAEFAVRSAVLTLQPPQPALILLS